MKRLLIIGAGGFGREVLQYTRNIQSVAKRWDTVGFLDDNPSALDSYTVSASIVDTIKNYRPIPGDELICAIGNPKVRVAICEELVQRGGKFTTIIHPTAIIGPDCQLGKGIIICYHSAVVANVKMGDFVMLNGLSSIGHDAVIGKGCTINAHCDVMGGAYFGENVFMGGGARVLPRVHVGDNATIGAGSVVISRIKPDITVFGNPARPIY